MTARTSPCLFAALLLVGACASPSGLAISSDDRYAFVTQEGVGSEPGAVDVIDLRALQKVATIDIGQQAGGIDFWKSVPPR
jgi:DNA-binding beta-propeller fold protein YncE